jgi:hypothetical protein
MKLRGSENGNISIGAFLFTFMYLVNLDTSDDYASSPSEESSCNYTLSSPILEERYSLISKNASSGLLNRGHYLLPFRVALPSTAPSSFHYNSYGLHGRIIYSLEVEVQMSGILKRNLKSQLCEVFLRQFSRDSVMPLQMVYDALLQPFWCTPASIAEVAVALDRNVYCPGDLLSLKFAINSASSARLKYIEVSLVRILRIGSLERCRRKETLLGRVNTGRVSGFIERRTSFTIPDGEAFSVAGRLIECKYELRFKIRADWCYSTLIRHEIKVQDSCLPTYHQSTATTPATTTIF